MVAFVSVLSVFAQDVLESGYEEIVFEKQGTSYSVDIKYPKITDKRLSIDRQQKANDEIEQFVHRLFDEDLKTFIENESQWSKEELKEIAGRDSVDISF